MDRFRLDLSLATLIDLCEAYRARRTTSNPPSSSNLPRLRIFTFRFKYTADHTYSQHVEPATPSDRSRYAQHGLTSQPAHGSRSRSRCLCVCSRPLTDPLPTLTGKRIALPTRVEPKVYFANERTFLSWLNFAVIVGALAVGMLNFGDKAAKISAFFFTGVAVLTLLYALRTYHWRAKSIRVRGQAGFDDRFGPTALAILLLVAVVANFMLRIVDSKKHGGNQA